MTEQEMESLIQQAATIIFSGADLEQAIRFYDGALARTRALGRKAAESLILSLKGNYICTTGRRYQGYLMIREAEKLALETGDPRAISTVRLSRAIAERWLGLPEKAVELTEGVVESLLSTFYIEVASLGIYVRGVALAEIGRIEEAMKILNDGIQTCESLGRHGPFGAALQLSGLLLHGDSTDRKGAGTEFPKPGIRSRAHGRKPLRDDGSAAEVVAHATVNLMENLFDLGDSDGAWELMKSFEQESGGDDYTRSRDRWGSRMDALAATILLDRDDADQAETL